MAAFPGQQCNSVEGRDVFLFGIPAGIVCGPPKPTESSCPSCVAWIVCIFLPASSLRLALGQHLTFTTGEQNHSISSHLRGPTSLRCLCEVKGHMRPNAQVSGGRFSCAFLSESFSGQPVQRVSLGGRSFVKCLRPAWYLQRWGSKEILIFARRKEKLLRIGYQLYK